MTKQPRETNGRWASNPFAHNPGRDNTPKAAPAVKKVSEGEGESYHARRNALGAKLSQAPNPNVYLSELALLDKFQQKQKQLNEQRAREKEERMREKEQRKRFEAQKVCSKYAPLFYSGSLYQEPKQYSPQIQDQLRKEATDASANLETLAEIAYVYNNTNFVNDTRTKLVRKLARVPSRHRTIDFDIGELKSIVPFYVGERMVSLTRAETRDTRAVVELIISNADEFNEDELKDLAEEFAVIGAAPVAKPTFFDKVVREGETFFVAVYEEDGDFFIETTHAQSSETYREMITDANKRSVAEKIVEKADKRYRRAKEAQREWEERERKREEQERKREELRGYESESESERNRRWRAEREQRKARRKARRKEIWTRPLFKKSN